jgi:hypothetical protein
MWRIALLVCLAACKQNGAPSQDLAVVFDLAPPPDLALPAAEDVAPAQTLSDCLAVDDTHVYWADDAGPAVLRAPKGGGPVETIASGGDRRGCVVIDGDNAYYTANGKTEIMMVKKDGTGGPMPLALGQHALSRLFADGSHVYFITDVYGAVDAFNGRNAVVRANPAAPGAVEVVHANVMGDPAGVAADATHVYFSDQAGVFGVPRAGGAALQYGMSTIKGSEFAVGATHLAMIEIDAIGAGGVAVMRLDGQGRIRVSNKLASTLAIDASGVYAKQDNRLVRFALDGTGTLPVTARAARAIALDATHVYFSDGATIARMLK